MTDIKVYNTDIAGRTSSLFQGELFVNLPDKLLGIGNTLQKQVRLNRFYPIFEQRYITTTLGITLIDESGFIEVIGCGGGGGGGSGASARSTSLTSASNGGVGGQGGQGGRFVFSIKELGLTAGLSKIDVNVGAGGAGGAGVANNNAVGSNGSEGSATWVVKSGLPPEEAIVYFSGGRQGNGGGRPSVGTISAENRIGYPYCDGIGYYDDAETANLSDEDIGGQGRGMAGNVTVDQGIDRDGRSNYYGGGGGGGGGGGWTAGGGGTTDGGYGGTGSVLNNLIMTVPPGQSGVTGKYGGGGGGGGVGGFGVGGGPGAPAIQGSGGGGGGGGGMRLLSASDPGSSGKGGTGGSGYVILRFW